MESNKLTKAQIQVLCSIINDNKVYFEYAKRLSVDLFFTPEYKNIFNSFVEIIKKGEEVDIISLSNHLNNSNSFSYVTELLSSYNFNMSFDNCIVLLEDENNAIKLQKFALGLNQMVLSGESTNEILSFVKTRLNEFYQNNSKEPKQIAYHIQDLVDHIKEMELKGFTGYRTGFRDFDSFSGGLQPSDLVIIAGATSQGKTSFALNIAKNCAMDYGVSVGIFSLEMSERQLTARIVSQESSINNKDILRGRIEKYQLEQIKQSINSFINVKIFIDDCQSNTLDYICNSIRSMVIKHDIKVFVIDYLQLISNAQKGKTKEQEVGEIARTFKNLAKETNTNIILLSQLNRNKDQRGGNEPRLSDLRDSGQIEEAADVVCLIYRAEHYGILQDEDGNSTEGKADLIIAKGRSIGITRIKLNFIKTLTKFTDNEQGEDKGTF